MPDDDDAVPVAEAPLVPEEVSARSFPTAFRGFDPVEVRAFLARIADELRRLYEQEAALRANVEVGGDARDASADAAALLAEATAEADRLVREARERVATLGNAATAEATRVLEQARAEALKVRAARSEEAESTAVRKLAEAEREAASIRVKAREDADETIEAARQRGREMVAEAQAARERMLADLAKRKRAAQAQLEQLRVGRDRLLDTLRVARRSIDEMTTRFEVQEGGAVVTPPSGGTVSAPVTTTPGMAAVGVRPRPATQATTPSAESGERARSATRSRSVTIGEGPMPSSRPQVPASAARGGSDPQLVTSTPTSSAPPAPVPPRSPAAVEPTEDITPERRGTEERKSSALRILRRNRAAKRGPVAAPPLIGRDSSAEGVRILGPADDGGPAAEVAEAADAAELPPAARPVEPVVESVGQPDDVVIAPATDEFWPERAQGEPEAASGFERLEGQDVLPEDSGPADEPTDAVEPLVARLDPLPEEGHVLPEISPDELPPPLAQDEIRPRIEDLFARIRADRESAVESARRLLADDPPGGSAATGERANRQPAAAPGGQALPANDADEHRLQARDAVVEPLAAQLIRRLKRALQDEQNSSLDRLRTSRGPVRAEAVLAAAPEQALPYRHLAESFLEEAARAGASASSFGTVSVGVHDLAMQLSEDITGALRARLDQVLRTSASEDVDLGSQSERISGVYREWKGQKIERLVLHYLIASHQRGNFLAHPEGTPLRWILDDEGQCPDCEDNGLAGPTPRGEPYPTGQLHPPAHLGCRCLLAPAST